MPKTVPPAFQTKLDAGVTTFAVALEIVPATGDPLRFTSHDQPVKYQGEDWLPGIVEGKDPQAVGLDTQSQGMTLLVGDTYLSIADLEAGRYDGAVVRVYTFDWTDPDLGQIKGLKGTIGRIQTGETKAEVEVRGIRNALSVTVGKTFTKPCRFDLGDVECGVNLAGFTVTGTVTSATPGDRRVFNDSSRTEADNTFDQGLLTWTSGNNAGRAMEVKLFTQAAGKIELVLGMPVDLTVGDGYSMYRGCDKTLATCRDVFSNVPRHGGFPYVPGTTRHLKTGTQ